MYVIKLLGVAAVVALTLTSSASAAIWHPQNAVRHGHGNLTLTTGMVAVVFTATLNGEATGDAMTTTNAAGAGQGPTLTNGTNNLGLTPTTGHVDQAWLITATSTTVVDLNNLNLTIDIAHDACTITTAGVSVPDNSWSNTTHTLTFSSATAFDVTRSGFCPGTATTGTLSGSVVFPSDVVIT